jgi:hypothetical protein
MSNDQSVPDRQLNKPSIPRCFNGVLGSHLKSSGHGKFREVPGNCPVTLWQFNIAIENDPFIVDLPIKDCDFP